MNEFQAGDLLRAKNKKTVPINFQDKRLIIIQGPKQVRTKETSAGYSRMYWLMFQYATIWEVFCIEDSKYYEFYTHYLRDYFKLEHRPQTSESK